MTQTAGNFGASFGLAAPGTLLLTERRRLTTRLVSLGGEVPAREDHPPSRPAP